MWGVEPGVTRSFGVLRFGPCNAHCPPVHVQECVIPGLKYQKQSCCRVCRYLLYRYFSVSIRTEIFSPRLNFVSGAYRLDPPKILEETWLYFKEQEFWSRHWLDFQSLPVDFKFRVHRPRAEQRLYLPLPDLFRMRGDQKGLMSVCRYLRTLPPSRPYK
jgi:hypothetical protein